MHFEILVEDLSGKELLEILVPRIIKVPESTYTIHHYRGLGRLPKDLQTRQDASKRILLEQLPRLLKGYGKTWASSGFNAVVIVVVDCDDRPCVAFKKELLAVLKSFRHDEPKPDTFFRIAVEEIEAWLLGDRAAIQSAYPKCNNALYASYKQDSITGTWERLADILFSRSVSARLKKSTYQEIGKQKSEWARRIGKYMNVQNNISPSFNCFKQKLEELSGSFSLNRISSPPQSPAP